MCVPKGDSDSTVLSNLNVSVTPPVVKVPTILSSMLVLLSDDFETPDWLQEENSAINVKRNVYFYILRI